MVNEKHEAIGTPTDDRREPDHANGNYTMRGPASSGSLMDPTENGDPSAAPESLSGPIISGKVQVQIVPVTLVEPVSPGASKKRKETEEPPDRGIRSKCPKTHCDRQAYSFEDLVAAHIEADDHSIPFESVVGPSRGGDCYKAHVTSVNKYGGPTRALLLDGTLRTLLRAVIESERDHTLHVIRAEEQAEILKKFRSYAHEETKQLAAWERFLDYDSDGEAEMVGLRLASKAIQDKLEVATQEEKNSKLRVDYAAWCARKRHLQALRPLENALWEAKIVGDEKALPYSIREFEEFFAVPDPGERYPAPEIVRRQEEWWDREKGRLRSSRTPRLEDFNRSNGSYTDRVASGRPAEGNDEAILDHSRFPITRAKRPHVQESPSVRARRVFHSCRHKLHEAQRRFDQRDRQNGADYFLRHRHDSRHPGEGPLEFDLRQFQENNALTRALIDAEKQLAEAKKVAQELNVHVAVPSDTSGFNDPDGDTDPERRMSAIHYTAIGVRTDQIDDWMKTLPDVETHDTPRIEPRPEKPELDEWSAEPIGNNESSSVIAGGRRREKINAEKQAAENRKRGARDEWCQSYPKRRRITFDKWHENKRGGVN
jgi:hypothetical protein